MKTYTVAAVQMNSLPDVQKNLTQAEELIELAANQGASLVSLPENFSFMGPETEKVQQAEEIAEKTEKFLQRVVKKFQITLLGGSFPVPNDDGKVYNTSVIYTPDGEEVCRYHKVHLFDVKLPDGNTYEESATVSAGTSLPPIYRDDTFGNLGLSICYDVRFPELYRYLAKQGAEILFVPAAFTAYTGKDHWQALLQARAIENTCYVVAAAQTGKHYGRRQSHGHAIIIDPWGIVLSDAGEEPGIAIATIEPSHLEQVRRQMPSLQHRVF